jgi:hypothetical protein
LVNIDYRAFFITEIKDGSSLDEINLQLLEPIVQAYDDVERQEQKSAARRWLNN